MILVGKRTSTRTLRKNSQEIDKLIPDFYWRPFPGSIDYKGVATKKTVPLYIGNVIESVQLHGTNLVLFIVQKYTLENHAHLFGQLKQWKKPMSMITGKEALNRAPLFIDGI
jgi:hypothetical protein